MQLIKGMISQGHGIGPRVVNPLGLRRRQANAGGILPVHHYKGDIPQPPQGPQLLFQVPQPRLPYNIAHR